MSNVSIQSLLLRGASFSFIVKITGAAVTFGLQIVLARVLGYSEYGLYTFILGWVTVFALFCRLGFDGSLVRYVPDYRVHEQWALLKGILVKSSQYMFSASVVVILSAVIVLFVIRPSIPSEHFSNYLIGLPLILFFVFLTSGQSVLRGLKHVVLGELPYAIIRPLLLCVGVLFIHYYLGSFIATVFNALILHLSTAFFSCCLLFVFFLRKIPKEIIGCSHENRGKEWLLASFPFLWVDGMQIIINQSDVLLIGLLLGTEQTGIYNAASKIAGLALFGITAANMIAAPLIAENYAKGDLHKLQEVVTSSARLIFASTVAISLFLIITGNYLLEIFGAEFKTAYAPMIILVFGQIINALTGSVGYLMTMTGHQRQAAIILSIGALLNIILNYILIPRFGLYGAAIATAVTTALWNITMFFFVKKKLNISSSIIGNLWRS